MSTEAIFNLRVNTGNSIEDINDFDKSVDNLNKSIQETQTTLESGKGIDAFEKNLDDLDKKLKEGNLSIRQQSKLIKEYQTIALQAGESSPIGQRAINSAAQLTDRLGDLRAQTTALSSDTVKLDTALQGIETGAAVFQGLQSAIALTGVENEDLVKTMVKLQAVQGVVNAVNVVARNLNKEAILGLQLRIGLEKAKNFILTGSIASTTGAAGAENLLTGSTLGATFAMKAFRAALIATGIGILIVGLGFLISNLDKVTVYVQKLSGYVLKAYDYFDNLGVAVKVLIGIFFPFIGVVYGAIKALEYFNILDTKTERDMSARHEANMKRVDKELAKREKLREQRERAYNNEQKAIDRQIALLDAQGKSTDALEEKKIRASINYQKQKLKELELEQYSLNFMIKSTGTIGEAYQGLFNENAKAIDEIRNNIEDSENQLLINQIENSKKKVDNKKKETKEKLLSEDEFYNIQQDNLKRQNEAELKAIQESEKNQIQAQNDLLNALEIIAEENRQRFLSDQENEIQAVNDKYFTLEEQAKGNTEQLAIIETAKLNEINDINLKYQQEQLDNSKRLAEEQKKIDAEKTANIISNIQKVLEVAQAVQNTFGAFNNLLNAQDNERLKQVRGNTAEEEKIKRRMFEREKKMRLAQVAIDTASAVVKSVAASPETFGLPFSAFALATGIANAMAIKATTFDGGATPSSGGGAPTTGASASSFTQQSNQTTETNLTGANLPTEKASKVYVLESDITRIQGRVKVQEATSSY
jgi:hypothetical protein